MSRGETGARSASASSWAFWLTLPFLARIVWKASVKLFCRPCLLTPPPPVEDGLHRELLLSLRGIDSQRSGGGCCC